MSPIVRQLPVKSLSWTGKVLLSAFLTWTTLNYVVQPQQVLLTMRQLVTAVRKKPLKAVAKSFRRLQQHSPGLRHSSNSIS
jgi:hypothetical protein